MRGNEIAQRPVRPAVARAFPIPMRGNELFFAANVCAQAVSWFPIPMRGNELVAVPFTDGAASQFPIPMRGNEHGKSAPLDAPVSMFPIPMRGNEQ